MGLLYINPTYRDLMCRLGLTEASRFLELQGIILGGHPDRHVMHVELGSGRSPVRAFLKKEHRIPWKHRLANWLSGFGWVSKSAREAKILLALGEGVAEAESSKPRFRIPGPQVMACGESRGRAFLLLREETDLADLRTSCKHADARTRRQLAQALGRELARMHAQGFDHPDLFAKHILAGCSETGWRFCILDWQRSQMWKTVSWRRRTRDLAALDATLADELATDRDRLAFLRTYLRATHLPGSVQRLSALARAVRNVSLTLQSRRRIRDMRLPPLPIAQQNLIWLDGEALCVTRQFLGAQGGVVPDCVLVVPSAPAANCVTQTVVSLSDEGRRGLLVRRWRRERWNWLFAWVRRRSYPAPEFKRADELFRLERRGARAPRVLALGHRTIGPGHQYSFLLTEAPEEIANLDLADHGEPCFEEAAS